MSELPVPPVPPRLTRGGAEGRLILQLAALRHLGVAGLILAGLRVWGGGRAGGEGTWGRQARLALLLAEPPAQVADEQRPGSSRQQKEDAVGEA